jgi:hypothetical protein
MSTQIETGEREIILLEGAHIKKSAPPPASRPIRGCSYGRKALFSHSANLSLGSGLAK